MTEVSEVKGVNEAKEVKEQWSCLSHPKPCFIAAPYQGALNLPFKPLASGACETSDP